ncbi:MAG: hypothetical protein M5U28_17770 [Sandaracinaceae bacterium]|nr:hypothetical protein [Sandaracinaceae bacterium]
MRLALLALALALPAAPARAQERPEVVFVLGRAEPPPVSSAALPPRARAAYARTLELRGTVRAVATLPHGELRRARLERLDAALAEAFLELERALDRARASLDAAGWRVLGEARIDRALRAYLDLLDAYDADPERAPMPEHPELGRALEALRRAAALAPRPEEGAWGPLPRGVVPPGDGSARGGGAGAAHRGGQRALRPAGRGALAAGRARLRRRTARGGGRVVRARLARGGRAPP